MANINDRQLYKVDKCIFLVDKSLFCTFNKSNNKTTSLFCLSYVFSCSNHLVILFTCLVGNNRGTIKFSSPVIVHPIEK